MQAMKQIPFIFAVHRLLRALEQEAGIAGLDHRAKALLLLIAEGDASGSALSVGDVVAGSNLGTAPTVYTALSELEAAGWIERRRDDADGRARRLCLTSRARKVFARMSRRANDGLRAALG